MVTKQNDDVALELKKSNGFLRPIAVGVLAAFNRLLCKHFHDMRMFLRKERSEFDGGWNPLSLVFNYR